MLFSEKAYLSLRKKFLNLEIPPKEPLSEARLSQMLGMSRTPVREAIKKLSHEGFLSPYGRKGYIVSFPTLQEIKDLYEVRILLEGGAVKLAAPKVDVQRLEQFEKQIASFLEDVNDNKAEGDSLLRKTRKGYEYLNLGRKFHLFIVQTAGNEKLREMIERINNHLHTIRAFSYERRKEEAIREHLEIIHALRERDGEKCQACMVKHLTNAFNALVRIV